MIGFISKINSFEFTRNIQWFTLFFHTIKLNVSPYMHTHIHTYTFALCAIEAFYDSINVHCIQFPKSKSNDQFDATQIK